MIPSLKLEKKDIDNQLQWTKSSPTSQIHTYHVFFLERWDWKGNGKKLGIVSIFMGSNITDIISCRWVYRSLTSSAYYSQSYQYRILNPSLNSSVFWKISKHFWTPLNLSIIFHLSVFLSMNPTFWILAKLSVILRWF